MLTHTYDIEFNDKELASMGMCGITRHLYQKILLDTVSPLTERNVIFLHELIHTIERHTGMKLDDMDIDRLAEGLGVFLFDNLGLEFDWSDFNKKEGG